MRARAQSMLPRPASGYSLRDAAFRSAWKREASRGWEKWCEKARGDFRGVTLHLYAIASGPSRLTEDDLSTALSDLGHDFELDPGTAWSVSAAGGELLAAGIHHAPERCGSHRYVASSERMLTWYDGWPVARDGGTWARDAHRLRLRWETLDGRLEGQFSAAQVDLQEGAATVLTDTLGLSQVFCARRERMVLISNSATLLGTLLELSEPDPLGVSSFMGLGWSAGRATLRAGVRVLEGGARHHVRGGELRTEQSFGPASIGAWRRGPRVPATELARSMTCLTAAAVEDVERVGCALTAGRDTRVMAALLQHTDAHPLYFTGGASDSADVEVACEIAGRLGLDHEVVIHDPDSEGKDWTRAATLFMRQNDGLSSLLQLRDYIDLEELRPVLGVKLWGVGGEIGRAGTGHLTAVATNVPLLRRSPGVQQRLLAVKARDEGGLMTAAAREQVASYLRGFQEQRLDEGWRPQEIQEAFYTFERVGRWGATGPRRMAGTDDIFSPFCSRPFIEYCFSLHSGERYVEAPHYRLLSVLSPELREHRFEQPFRTQRHRLARLLATRQLLEQAYARVPRRHGAAPPPPATAGETGVQAQYAFQHRWLERRLDLAGQVFAVGESPLWEFVDRDRVHGLLRGEEADRARWQEPLLRALTVFWHFYGPVPERAPVA